MTRPTTSSAAAPSTDKRHEPDPGAVIRLISGRRSKYFVIVLWLALIVVASLFSGKLGSVQKNDNQSFLPASAESTQVVRLETAFSSPNTLPAAVIYTRPTALTGADRAKVVADARSFGRRTDLDGSVGGPMFSSDGRAAQVIVPLDLGPDGFSKAAGAVSQLRHTAAAGANGMTIHIAGPAGSAADQSNAVSGVDTTLLLATMAVIVAILLLTYRSPLLWLLPLASAGVSLVGAQALIYLLARYAGLTVSADGAAILTILVFGASTDYALLLIARYREELRRYADRHDAMAVALRRAGPAIIASASTVAIGMLCLLLATMNSTKGLGPVFALGIVVGLAVMITLFPALLLVFGRWVFWPSRPRFGDPQPAARNWWARMGTGIARRPRWVWVTAAVVLAAVAVGIGQLNSTGLTNKESFRGYNDSVAGETVLARHFGASGAGSPVEVVTSAGGAARVRDVMSATPGIAAGSATSPIIRGGHAYLTGTLTAAPDSAAAASTVDRLRDRVRAVPGADAKVGGDTALNLDVQRASAHDRNLIIPVVLIAVLLILIILLRAIVAPLLLIGTVVLSLTAALGASVLVFRHVFGFAGEDSSFPLYVFVFLVALGIDYNIFLMSRVREEAARHGTRPATIAGLAATGGVITSAGLVLAGTFAVLGTLPLTQFAELGFAVALGILLDTIVVRSVLVTALNLDIGRHIWWPSRLARVPDEPLPVLSGEREPA